MQILAYSAVYEKMLDPSKFKGFSRGVCYLVRFTEPGIWGKALKPRKVVPRTRPCLIWVSFGRDGEAQI